MALLKYKKTKAGWDVYKGKKLLWTKVTFLQSRQLQKKSAPLHFRVTEFLTGCGNIKEFTLSEKLINKLELLRNRYGAITINSGFRTPALNKKVGGVPNSRHTKGCACDIFVKKDLSINVAWYARQHNVFGIELYDIDPYSLHIDNRGLPAMNAIHKGGTIKYFKTFNGLEKEYYKGLK